MFPFTLAIIIPLTCLVPYWMSVKIGFVDAIFPLVSDTGSGVPSGDYFAQLIDLGALLSKFSNIKANF